MKKRLLSLLLALCTAVSLLTLPAGAAETVTFSDVGDRDTAQAVESLRLMGVLDGYGDGSFRPGAALNRAQFCKMAVYAMAGADQLGLYRTVTVFPDVKPSHWASAFINMAAKGKNVISGYPDGRFHPERTVTVGQAVTILLRLLGYKDENVGGVWPDSYMAVGAQAGLTDGVGLDGRAPLTRGQAARLFLNLLRADMAEGGSYLASIGTAKTAVLASAAGGNDGKSLVTTDGDTYSLASGKASNGMLNGQKGTLVLNKAGKALTFVPDALGTSRTVTISTCTSTQIVDTSGVKYSLTDKTETYYNGETTTWGEASSWLHAGSTVTLYLDAAATVSYVFVGGGKTSSAAVVVYADKSSAGFDSLTGGVTNYSIYKNGSSAGLGDLRKYDVATYSSATNSIRICDTRVTVFYESCSPNPKEPAEITALGTTFTVLPTAMDSVAKFKPGDQMTLLLTEDGQVAGAVEASGSVARSNAVRIVQGGKVQMLCGSAKIQIESDEAADFDGQLVRISSGRKGEVNLSRLSGGTSGDLKVDERKLGSKDLAENVMLFRDGADISLSQLTDAVINSGKIIYARTNWAGKVDLIVLSGTNSGGYIYGRVFWESTRIPVLDENGEETGEYEYDEKLGVEFGNGKEERTKAFGMKYNVQTGDFVAATINRGGTGFSSLVKLTELKNVSNGAWNGKTAVTVGGRTYTVPADVLCYNRQTKSWVSLNEAHAYADVSNLYAKDGVIRCIEVG